MPSLLSHLFPLSASGLLSYGPEFLPSLFTSLPAPVMVEFCTALLHHLSHGISLASDQNTVASVKKAGLAFELIMGPAVADGEAMDAITTMLRNGRTAESGAEQRARMVISWVARGGHQGTSPRLLSTSVTEVISRQSFHRESVYHLDRSQVC